MNNPKTSTDTRRVLAPVRYPVGGIRNFIRYVYPVFLGAGYRFTFVGPEGSLFAEFQSQISDWEGIEFCHAPVVGKKWHARGLMRRLLREKSYALIHSHGLTAGLNAAIANLGIGVPHVLSSHGVVAARDFVGLKGRLRREVTNVLLRTVDRVVAESNDARENHLQCFRSLRRPDRTVTILNGIVPPAHHGSELNRESQLRKQLGLEEETFLIGFFGRFMPEKGFPVLLDAIQRIEDQEAPRSYHVITTGADDYVREYRRDVAERVAVARRITFMGQVPDLETVLEQMDLVVMPSLWEACPLLPMEAMALGVPILASDCIGQREVLHGTPARVFPSGDVTALAEGIVRAMMHPWKEEARDYVPNAICRFDVRRTAEQLCVLFDELCGPRQGQMT